MQFETTFSNRTAKKKIVFLIAYLTIATISCTLFLAINITDSINIYDITSEIWVSFGLLNISGIFFILAFVEYIRMPPSQVSYNMIKNEEEMSIWSYDFILNKLSQPRLKKHIINIKIKNRQQVRIARKIYANYPVKHVF